MIRMMKKMNKRGISPIFATVLLIAFAVAIGAMIMNWSAGLTLGPSCDKAEIEVTGSAVCIAGNVIKLSLKNTGDESISDLIIGSEKSLKGIDAKPGEGINAEVDFSGKISERDIRIIPVIKDDDEKSLECTEKAFVVDKVENCG